MKKLHDWFWKHQRPFPWREDRTPYKVWISEVMLQQTRASVVVPYFLRWMNRFPNALSLAKASLEEVIKEWEGLGYYSRARNLHKGAQQIVINFDGNIPDSKEKLEMISGLGPYTIGAILSFGFQKKAAAVDGNVTRVISRLYAIEENICKMNVRKQIEKKAEDFLDAQEPWITVEALIELGATVCLPQPRCTECPLQSSCEGNRKKIAAFLPVKNKEKQITSLTRIVAIVESQSHILVQKREQGKVMADLYEFPYFEGQKALHFSKYLGFEVEYIQSLKEVTHTFTRFKARLLPFLLKADCLYPLKGGVWVRREQLLDLPFSAGHRKIAKGLNVDRG